MEYMESKMQDLIEGGIQQATEQTLCKNCGSPATCIGSYEGSPIAPACDKCCGHGNEDGYCNPIKHPQ